MRTLFAEVLAFDDVFGDLVSPIALWLLPGDDAGLGEDIGDFDVLWLLGYACNTGQDRRRLMVNDWVSPGYHRLVFCVEKIIRTKYPLPFSTLGAIVLHCLTRKSYGILP